MTLAFLTLLTGFSTAIAKDREDKLIDRIPKPDMSLSNAAQNKRFATANAAVGRTVRTSPFYASEKSLTPSIQQMPAVSPASFSIKSASPEGTTANFATRSLAVKAEPTAEIEFLPTSSGVAPENTRHLKTSSFPDQRPFLVNGKSQKALAAQDRPLTIEEVRELLNKNK